MSVASATPSWLGSHGERSALGAALAMSVFSIVATWTTYLIAKDFLYFWLPGYPVIDWLCGGECSPRSFVPLTMPIALVLMGQLALFIAARRSLGAVAGWRTLAASLASPAVIIGEVSIMYGLGFFTAALMFAARAARQRELEWVALAMGVAVAPLPVAIGLGVFGACEGRWWRRLLVAGLVAAALGLRIHFGFMSDTMSLPGPAEIRGASFMGWLVAVPVLVGATVCALDDERRALGLGVLVTVVAGVWLGLPPMRALGAAPLAWAVVARLPSPIHRAFVIALALWQGVMVYHLAHQVPVL